MSRIIVYLRIVILCPVLSLILVSCVDLFIDPDPNADHYTVFNILWTEIDRYYPFFDIKEVDWREVRNAYEQRIHSDMTEKELFDMLGAMVNLLRDGHLNIFSPHGISSYTGWYDSARQNFYRRLIESHYLRNSPSYAARGIITFGRYGDIGYIHISTFSGTDPWQKAIDSVLVDLGDTHGLIVDIRDNSGGNSANARYIASRFADREYTFTFTQYRSGPDHDDFTNLQPHTIGPAGMVYDKPVALLTNRRCYSAAEDFTLAMKMFPNVVHIGDRTGGGFGSPVFRELPNGWVYRLPVWRQFTHMRENLSDFSGIVYLTQSFKFKVYLEIV
jgi:hypothetical protein